MRPFTRVGVIALLAATAGSAHSQAVPAGPLTLDDVIRLAQAQGSAVMAARQTLDGTRYSYQSFTAGLRPRLSLTGQALDFNRGINPVVTSEGETRYVSQSENQSSIGFQVQQRLKGTGGTFSVASGLARNDQFGLRTSQSWRTTPVILSFNQPLFQANPLKWEPQIEAASLSIAERQYVEAREDAGVSAAAAFFDLLIADIDLRNALSNVAINDTINNINKVRYDRGAINEAELLQSNLALSTSSDAAERERVTKDRAEATLRRLLNLPLGAPVSVVTPGKMPLDRVDPDVAVKQALENGSAREQWDLDALQARRRVEDARLNSGFSATVSTNVGFNQTAPTFLDSYQSPQGRQSASLSVSMPILQGDARKADIASSKASLARTEISARSRQAELSEEARFAALGFMQSIRSLSISAQSDSLAVRRFSVVKAQYEAGTASLTDLLQAQDAKDRTRSSSAQALRGYWMAYYQLRRLTLYDFVTGAPIRN